MNCGANMCRTMIAQSRIGTVDSLSEYGRTMVAASVQNPSLNDHEFEFTTADFERVRELIRRRAGINLNSGKQAMVYSRLSRRLREVGIGSFKEYLNQLDRADTSEAEWQGFVNCLTTNLTSFFREAHHFEILSDVLKNWKSNSCRIWCNAASTGEEPYSLAMTVAECLKPGISASIICSDIDTNVLATASKGVYPDNARGLSPERLRRHFLKGKDGNAGKIRVKPELAKLIQFRTFNLMSSNWSLGDPFDIVFCRNVMIYFDHDTQMRVLKGIHSVMRPKGLLFVGHSENFTEARDLFRLQGKTVYERLGA